MKKRTKALWSLILTASMLMSMAAVPTFAEDEDDTIYAAPETPAVTYNMNLDWKFKESPVGMGNKKPEESSVQAAWKAVAVGGKQFYEVGYDDSAWETVSIPHGINGEDAFTSNTRDAGGGFGRLGVFLYRKEFTVPAEAAGGKVFFEMEGIRQAAYVWVNGRPVGYYEAGIAPFGMDLTDYVTPGQTALIAICDDCSATSGNPYRFAYETVPGDAWGSSFTPDNFSTAVGGESGIVGAAYQWNVRSFNETQAGLVYDAYLHIKGNVYQTLPLYNNLKTTGNYIYADNFTISPSTNKATIHVKSEVRNESAADGNYTLEVAVVDNDGKLAYKFESAATQVKAATDAGVVYETAVESDVYSAENIANPVGITKVNTPDVTYIEASYEADDVRFWTDTDPYLYTVYTILRDSSGKAVDIQKKDTGFRKVTYDANQGVLINDKPVWLKGYAQRSTNEWAVIGVATDWLQDYDMELLKKNNANFIRWMHVAPKPAEVRSSDRYGVLVACPAGDKEGDANGRQWSQRAEAMRDAMIYFRNSPSVLFWETGNSAVSASHSQDMAAIRDEVDPYGMRFIGARSTASADQLNYEWNYAGTMYGGNATGAKAAMTSNGIMGPIMETEYAREESPRRVWDDYSPPDFDYVNKALHKSDKVTKQDGADAHDMTQEDITISNIREYNGYYSNRAGNGSSLYSAEAMMVWSDSNMHGRNTASENCRTSGRVDPVRQTKEMFEGTRVAHSDGDDVHIVGHWSYPTLTSDNYWYFEKSSGGVGTIYVYDKTKKKQRDPLHKTVYVIGSKNVSKVELYRLDGETETLLGTDSTADSNFIYQIDNVDVTQGDAVIAKAYNARDELIKTDKIERTYDAVSIKLVPHTSVDADGNGDWRADGADIAYYDVQVVDKNGNVCALNYDRINFTYSGEGEYLGGYNSGTGAGCFQNLADSEGLSNYFGGAKDGVSTIRKDYVYAENGTNRIFVKSTRNAGTFTLTADMTVNGKKISSAPTSIESTAVETTGGLTLEMPSHLVPGLSSERPSVSTVSPMLPLTDVFTVNWLNRIIVKEVDTNTYYDVYVNGTKLVSADDKLAKSSAMGGVYGPTTDVFKALETAGLTVDWADYPDKLRFTAPFYEDGTIKTFEIRSGSNQLYWGTGDNETVDGASTTDGELFIHYSGVFQYTTGIDVDFDNENKTVNITYAAQ